MREVLVEQVEWKRDQIEQVALKMLGFYIHGLGFLGTKPWTRFTIGVVETLRKQNPAMVHLDMEGFSLIFAGPRPLAPRSRGNDVFWSEAEPHLTFFDDTLLRLAPGIRNRIYKLNRDVIDEAEDTYKLKVVTDPLSFIFPKHRYASVGTYRGVILR